MKNQQEKIPFWAIPMTISFFLYLYALFVCSESLVAGRPMYVWFIWASYFGFLLGAAIGVMQLVSRRQHLRKLLNTPAEDQAN